MTDATTIAFGILASILIVALIVAIALVVAWVVRETRRRRAYDRAGVSHLDLYFDEHFPNIVRNFDLVTTPRFEAWSNGITARLSNLSRDLDVLGRARQGLDARMDRIEKRLGDLE